jgi:hypothetical protein
MSCCGGKRRQFQASPSIEPIPEASAPPAPARPPVTFEYVGTTGLTATGPYTGRRYRFDGPGARVEVDERDAPSLAAVPRLRRVRAAV